MCFLMSGVRQYLKAVLENTATLFGPRERSMQRVVCLFRSVDRSARKAPLTPPKLGLERDTLPRVPISIRQI